MKFHKVFWFPLSLLFGLGVSGLLAPACGGSDADDSADLSPRVEQLHFHGRHHFVPRVVGTGGAAVMPSGTGGQGGAAGAGGGAGENMGGTGGTGGAIGSRGAVVPVDCDVCTKANICCDAVGGGPLCTFSAATCSAYTGAAREAYVKTCVNLIATTATANPGERACQ